MYDTDSGLRQADQICGTLTHQPVTCPVEACENFCRLRHEWTQQPWPRGVTMQKGHKGIRILTAPFCSCAPFALSPLSSRIPSALVPRLHCHPSVLVPTIAYVNRLTQSLTLNVFLATDTQISGSHSLCRLGCLLNIMPTSIMGVGQWTRSRKGMRHA